MTDKWPKLDNPPVVLAVMEIRFQLKSDIDVVALKKDDSQLLLKYPNRSDNFKGNINLPTPTAGISTAKISSKQVGYSYLNLEKTHKLVITKENLIFAIEGVYPGWPEFKEEGLDVIHNFKHILSDSIITRVSMRFVNRINIQISTIPEDYFNTSISAREGTIEYPIDSYFFKYSTQIPNTKINSNVIQSLEEKSESDYSFVFDIDVLCHERNEFSIINFANKLEELREVKNDIFFKNLTKKTLEQL